MMLLTLVLMLVLILVAGLFCACESNQGGDASMQGDVEAVLRQIDYTKPEQVKALSAKIREQGYRHLRELVEWYGSKDSAMSINAAAVLIDLSELATVPLLDNLSSEPEKLVWEMQQAVEAQLAVRERLVTQLEAMLGNTSPVLAGDLDLALEEQPPAPRRVCDEAYLMLRRLVSFESDARLMDNTEGYFDLTFEERDEEIKRVQETRVWKALIGQEPDDDGEDL